METGYPPRQLHREHKRPADRRRRGTASEFLRALSRHCMSSHWGRSRRSTARTGFGCRGRSALVLEGSRQRARWRWHASGVICVLVIFPLEFSVDNPSPTGLMPFVYHRKRKRSSRGTTAAGPRISIGFSTCMRTTGSYVLHATKLGKGGSAASTEGGPSAVKSREGCIASVSRPPLSDWDFARATRENKVRAASSDWC